MCDLALVRLRFGSRLEHSKHEAITPAAVGRMSGRTRTPAAARIRASEQPLGGAYSPLSSTQCAFSGKLPTKLSAPGPRAAAVPIRTVKGDVILPNSPARTRFRALVTFMAGIALTLPFGLAPLSAAASEAPSDLIELPYLEDFADGLDGWIPVSGSTAAWTPRSDEFPYISAHVTGTSGSYLRPSGTLSSLIRTRSIRLCGYSSGPTRAAQPTCCSA